MGLTWSLWLHRGSGARQVVWCLPPPSPPYWYDHLGARASRYGLFHQGHLTQGLELWCFPHSELGVSTLWCRSHIKVLEDFGRTPGSVFQLVLLFSCAITRYFPFFPTETPHALDLIGFLGANLFLDLLQISLTRTILSPYQIRLLAKACHRLCLVMPARRLRPPPRVHWGLPLCLNPVARLRQPHPQLLQARWDTENKLL